MVRHMNKPILSTHHYRSLTKLERKVVTRRIINILRDNGVILSERMWLKYEKNICSLICKADDQGCIFTTLKDLADDLNYSPPAIAKFLKTLDTNGLIYRRNGLIILTYLDEYWEEKEDTKWKIK